MHTPMSCDAFQRFLASSFARIIIKKSIGHRHFDFTGLYYSRNAGHSQF
jgi:hypothetical protein